MKSNHSSESGFTLVWVALCLVVLLAIGALAVDMAVLFTARTSAQKAADAAALAGAYTLVNDPAASQPATAQNAAVAVANQNNILGTGVTITASNVSVCGLLPSLTACPSAPSTQLVKVTVTGTAPSFLARVIGWNGFSVGAVATAEAAPVASGDRCIRPFWVRNSALSTPGTCNKPLINGSYPNGVINPAIASQMVVAPWVSVPLHLTTSPSQWGLLEACKSPSASCMDSSILSCVNVQVLCGDTVPAAPGNKMTTIFNVRTLIGSPPDTWVAPGVYTSNGATVDRSKSLIDFAIIDDCPAGSATWNTLNGLTGGPGTPLPVAGFGEIFVYNVNQSAKSIDGYLVNYGACGKGPGLGTGGPAAIPVRLVQTP